MFFLLYAPVQHCQIFFFRCRCKIDKIRNICHHRDILQSKMCHIVHSIDRTTERNNRYRAVVDTYILCNLIKGSLYKCAIHTIDRLSAICCDSCRQCNRCLFCNSDIDELPSCFFSLILCKSQNCRSSGSNGNNCRIFFHLLHEIIARHI